jgi:hypothetical protein
MGGFLGVMEDTMGGFLAVLEGIIGGSVEGILCGVEAMGDELGGDEGGFTRAIVGRLHRANGFGGLEAMLEGIKGLVGETGPRA